LGFWYRDLLLSIVRFFPLGPLGSRWLRPALYRHMGVHVGRNVHIGHDVYIDIAHPHLVTIEDWVGIAPRVTILAHERDLTRYRQGMLIAQCPYRVAAVRIGRGTSISTASIVLAGVTIGEGAVIGAGSLVNKNIPAYSLAAGSPVKVLKTFAKTAEAGES
jgi:acetyltransferase-like isoleucine patch superfamily enzyme